MIIDSNINDQYLSKDKTSKRDNRSVQSVLHINTFELHLDNEEHIAFMYRS